MPHLSTFLYWPLSLPLPLLDPASPLALTASRLAVVALVSGLDLAGGVHVAGASKLHPSLTGRLTAALLLGSNLSGLSGAGVATAVLGGVSPGGPISGR